jgi:hypothetical protein
MEFSGKIEQYCKCKLSAEANEFFNDLKDKANSVAYKGECCSGTIEANKCYGGFSITLEIRSIQQDECELFRYDNQIRFMNLINKNFSYYVNVVNYLDEYRIFKAIPKHEFVTSAEIYNIGSTEIIFRLEMKVPKN